MITNSLHQQLIKIAREFKFDKDFLNNTISLDYWYNKRLRRIKLSELTKSVFFIIEQWTSK